MKKKKFNVGILGLGEVGSSLKNVISKYYPVFGRTRDIDEIGNKKIKILHIAIPYSKNFIKIVVKQIKELKPELTIIESTVAVGTTRKISKQVKCLLAHSPVRGVHPHLEEGIKTFVKMVGGIDRRSAEETSKYYKSLGLKTFHCVGPETTELGKILSTTYYGWCIVFQKEAFRLCQKFGVDPSIAYDLFNLTYNEGYSKLGKRNVIRPILVQMNGPIGGHCIGSNCQILEAQSGNVLTRTIIRRNKTY